MRFGQSRTMRFGRLAAALTATALALGAAVGGTTPATAATDRDADAAMDAFVEAFWDPSRNYFFTYSDRQVHEEHAHGPEDGLYTDFWWEAQLWDLVMDAYER